VPSITGAGWNTFLRLHSPLEPWFDKPWCSEEIERVNQDPVLTW